MTTYMVRLLQAHVGIGLIKRYINDIQFTKEKFVTCQPPTDEYKTRMAALQEFEAVAQNLNFKGSDLVKLREKTDAEFVEKVRLMYGLRSITTYKYGVSASIDYGKVWEAFSELEGVDSVLERLIKEEEFEGRLE